MTEKRRKKTPKTPAKGRTGALTLKLRSPGLASRRHSAAEARRASGRPTPLAKLLAGARKALAPVGRVLAPAGRAASAALRRVAPAISEALLWAVRVPAALIATGLDLVLDLTRWVRSKAGPLSAGLYELAMRTVTPVRVFTVVCAGAAVALAASQFVDYRGIAVGAPGYEGEISTVAPAPFTDLKPAGSAHGYALVPLAAVALLLVALTARGRWRLGRAVGLIGLAGIVVGLAIDMPQGLDSGDSGVSYLGTDPRLIEGFWAQMAASATLLVAGPLLGFYAKRSGAPGESRSERRAAKAKTRNRRSPATRRPSGASA